MSIFNKVTKTFQWGGKTVTLETGEIARQSSGAVVVSIDDTVVLATVVAKKDAKPGQDFFPLTVDYIEKTYAAGKIPGSFFKREGRPSELETLTSRLIDRPLRPLFPEGFYNEVQVVIHVLSLNPEIAADIPSLIGASAALAISGIPFNGPIGAARVGYIDGQYVLNPTKAQMAETQMDLIVAGTEAAVLMVESEAKQLTEEVMLGGVVFGHEQGNVAIAAINELVRDAGKPVWDWQAPAKDEAFIAQVAGARREQAARRLPDPLASRPARSATRDVDAGAKAALAAGAAAASTRSRSTTCCSTSRPRSSAARSSRASRASTAATPAPCGRSRSAPASCRAPTARRCSPAARRRRWSWPRSAPTRDSQRIDALAGEYREHFMLHYNMPPFATGETGRVGSPKRREIGHGRLAKRALVAVLPDRDEFPYSMRVVSEITESNGSSSMASVCGGCLALMDAGVPMKAHVAGIAMGLIKEGNRFAVLTDILGDEDHLGDMDFKVAGTDRRHHRAADGHQDPGHHQGDHAGRAGAGQGSAPAHPRQDAGGDAAAPSTELSEFAPRLITMKINPEKIRDVIGKGGATIRALTEETGTHDRHRATTARSPSPRSTPTRPTYAKKRIEEITAEVEVGKIYEGPVPKILDFGAIVKLMPGKDGLLHICQIANERVKKVADYLKEGQIVRVKVLETDEKGRVKLSMKALLDREAAARAAARSQRDARRGVHDTPHAPT